MQRACEEDMFTIEKSSGWGIVLTMFFRSENM